MKSWKRDNQENLKRDNQENLIVLTGVTLTGVTLIGVTLEILLRILQEDIVMRVGMGGYEYIRPVFSLFARRSVRWVGA